MMPNVITATSNQTIRDVCKIMCEHEIGSIIILKDTTSETDEDMQYNDPVGITTERDVVTLDPKIHRHFRRQCLR
jgi:CBS domain-containing protein